MARKVIYQHLLPQRTFVPIMNLEYFHVVGLLHNSFVSIVTVVTSDIFCPKKHMCLVWASDTYIMHQSIPSTNIPPGNVFKVVKFPAPGQNSFLNYGPGAKNRQNPRPWGQFCGPSRQFCHDRETIRIFLVLFFSLAFFEFFQRL